AIYYWLKVYFARQVPSATIPAIPVIGIPICPGPPTLTSPSGKRISPEPSAEAMDSSRGTVPDDDRAVGGLDRHRGVCDLRAYIRAMAPYKTFAEFLKLCDASRSSGHTASFVTGL